MVPPYLTTLNTDKNKRKPSARQIKAQAEHEAWQRKNGVHPEQRSRKTASTKMLKSYLTIDRSGPQCNNGFAPGGAKKSIFDSQWQRTYEEDACMAEREAEALRAAESKKLNISQTYNKGPVMYAGSLKPTDFGKRR